VRELRRLLDGYMSQLATLTGSDVEAAMKKGLEAVDQLDAAVTLEKVGCVRAPRGGETLRGGAASRGGGNGLRCVVSAASS
jgi:hypothetical protein